MGREIKRLDRDWLIRIIKYFEVMGFDRLPLDVPTSTCLITNSGNGSCLMKEKELLKLRKEIGDCRLCRLSEKRTNIVFGEGNPEAELMFIGEGPGADEDLQGRPFVGKAGQLLTRLITKMGFKREDVYIANIVKCRPPNNRRPREDEINACMPFLKKQIEIINPRVIMTLGDVATKTLLGEIGSISKVRGKTYRYNTIKVVPTFHPSYLLRNPNAKWLTWNDAQIALRLLGR
ncbi:MAG: uracil-DNA glycosylase [Nitrospirae bacterium]|nr:uracil-DNA glycosylase [Nitrospirota bacterium]